MDAIEEIKVRYSNERMASEANIFNAIINSQNCVIDFAKMALKGSFILNGAAAIALSSIFASVVKDDLCVAEPLIQSAFWFSIGALVSVVATALSYFSQKFYQAYDSNNLDLLLVDSRIKQNNELFNVDGADKGAISKSNEVEKENGDAKQKQSKFELKKANGCMWGAVLFVFASLGFFAWNIYDMNKSIKYAINTCHITHMHAHGLGSSLD